ncbi:MAG: DUF421 domain-containing protein [Chitinophagales bacterium]|jgi:uncharacterized membrane protein YcaP (DUF421 family)|nr:DUF421 domain-containing protein [Bacteroidota bacterium]MBP8915184.1 DUF421 domain-containing protein [Chitinophagales bacterium]MBP9219832.1 DUF421 domain-containing protein [Chitinophagales bacterium]MBP9794414.1 DUF421 domain-containing protein [Chitinophagales bacterium]
MFYLQIMPMLSWKELMLGAENWSFLLETILRTFIMFIVILVSLRILGKRGVKQLSIFELVVIISLGSAAGDPMFYKDVGILPAIIVFTIVVVLYSFITYIIGRNPKFERIMEGKPICLIKNGVFIVENFSKEALGVDEFFAELRMQGVSQLGQIEEAIVESSGNISLFYFPDEKVKYGLPIMPDSLDSWKEKIIEPDHYACIFCGYTEKLQATTKYTCPECKKNKCVKATNKKRIR